MPRVIRYSTAGSYTWNSGGNTLIGIKLIGGGGGSSSATPPVKQSCPGGGGGASTVEAYGTYPVTPNTDYTINVGAGGGLGVNGGDTWFNTSATLLAKGGGCASGTSLSSPVVGAGGLAASGIGTNKYNGGDGGLGYGSSDKNSGGGGGGGSGGDSSNGNAGAAGNNSQIPAAGGAAVTGGGAGGVGAVADTFAASNGVAPGGGGGGVAYNQTTNGVGADGLVEITVPDDVYYTPQRMPTPVGPQVQRHGRYREKFPPPIWINPRQVPDTTFRFPQTVPPDRNKGPTALRRIKTPVPQYVDIRQSKTSEFGFRPIPPNVKTGPMVLRNKTRNHYLPFSGSSAAPVVATPDPGSLTLASFAPVLGFTITPNVSSLTLASFAPVIRSVVTPGVSSLMLTAFAPVLSSVITPGVSSLALTAFAPVLSRVITPGVASLVLTGYAPSFGGSISPGTSSLTLSAFAPSVSMPVIPGVGSLTLTAYAPSLGLSLVVTAQTAALVLTGIAPAVVIRQSATPGTASLVLTGYAPVVSYATAQSTMDSLSVHYLGRFSRGQYVTLICVTDYRPADVPIVDIWRNGTTLVREFELPRVKASDNVFRMPILMDTDFTDGVYSAVCRMEVRGVQKVVCEIFEVVGGEGLSPLISVTEIDRALGRAVVSQSASGVARIAYKPRRRN